MTTTAQGIDQRVLGGTGLKQLTSGHIVVPESLSHGTDAELLSSPSLQKCLDLPKSSRLLSEEKVTGVERACPSTELRGHDCLGVVLVLSWWLVVNKAR